jgi:hypothetical protein
MLPPRRYRRIEAPAASHVCSAMDVVYPHCTERSVAGKLSLATAGISPQVRPAKWRAYGYPA